MSNRFRAVVSRARHSALDFADVGAIAAITYGVHGIYSPAAWIGAGVLVSLKVLDLERKQAK